VRAAVVGAGRVARQHLLALARQPGVELVAVCDLSRAAAEAAAERHGARAWFTDHNAMLTAACPDVVHVTSPPQSHLQVASDAMDAGAHVVVEKPAATRYEDVRALVGKAEAANLIFVEDYNYLFNPPVRRLLALLEAKGAVVTHVEVAIGLDLLAPGGLWSDPNLPYHGAALRGGAVGDFLPHLASLAHAFVGRHRTVSTTWENRSHSGALPHDEFRALVQSELGTAVLVLSARTRPDVFSLRVWSTGLRAEARLFEARLTMDKTRPVPRPLLSVANGLEEAWDVGSAAVRGLWTKLSGAAGSYEGLEELVRRTYRALEESAPPPVTPDQILEVHGMIEAILEQAPVA
jgi:predicted dehydrogenase